jgi:hypothetical protein
VDSSKPLYEVHMRSGLIFNVSAKISNRYMLCRMLAASARKMHRDGVSTSQCINNSLRALQGAQPEEESKPSLAASEVTTAIETRETEALVP